jgi:hypothetical protein
MYRLLTGSGVLRLSDNACIPEDVQNRDWRKYQAWVAEGNTPEAAPEVPAETYVDLRRKAYPQIVDQLDMIYWDGVNGTTTWPDEIARIKALYPKNG